MSPKIVTIVGATGAQGKGVIRAFVNNPAYRIRALTRNPSSDSGKALSAQGIEVVAADVGDLSSLKSAFAGSSIIFGVTNFFELFTAQQSAAKATEVELQQGVNLAEAAASTLDTLEHYIWSTLPDSKAIAGGTLVPHYDSKTRADNYIRERLPQLLAKTTFLWVTFYHSNFQWPLFTPIHIPSEDRYIQLGSYAADTPLSTIGDPSINLAPFVKAIVEKTKGEGSVVLATTETLDAEKFLATWAAAKGVKAKFVKVSRKDFREIWPLWGEEIGLMMELWEELRDRSWSVTVPGQKLITREKLGIKEGDVQSLVEAFKGFEL